MVSVRSEFGTVGSSIKWTHRNPVPCTKNLEIIVRMCLMIITAIFRKDYTSIETFRMACGLYIPTVTQREVVLPMVAVSYRPENVVSM